MKVGKAVCSLYQGDYIILDLLVGRALDKETLGSGGGKKTPMKVTAALSRIPSLGPALHVYMCECTCVSGGVGPRREDAEL